MLCFPVYYVYARGNGVGMKGREIGGGRGVYSGFLTLLDKHMRSHLKSLLSAVGEQFEEPKTTLYTVVQSSHGDVRHGRVLSRVDVPLAVPGRSHDLAARDQPAEALLMGKSVPGSDRTPFVLYRRRRSRPLFRRHLSPETAKTFMKNIHTVALHLTHTHIRVHTKWGVKV